MAGETGSGFPVFKTEGGAFDRAKFNADLQSSMGANINPETADALKEANSVGDAAKKFFKGAFEENLKALDPAYDPKSVFYREAHSPAGLYQKSLQNQIDDGKPIDGKEIFEMSKKAAEKKVSNAAILKTGKVTEILENVGFDDFKNFDAYEDVKSDFDSKIKDEKFKFDSVLDGFWLLLNDFNSKEAIPQQTLEYLNSPENSAMNAALAKILEAEGFNSESVLAMSKRYDDTLAKLVEMSQKGSVEGVKTQGEEKKTETPATATTEEQKVGEKKEATPEAPAAAPIEPAKTETAAATTTATATATPAATPTEAKQENTLAAKTTEEPKKLEGATQAPAASTGQPASAEASSRIDSMISNLLGIKPGGAGGAGGAGAGGTGAAQTLESKVTGTATSQEVSAAIDKNIESLGFKGKSSGGSSATSTVENLSTKNETSTASMGIKETETQKLSSVAPPVENKPTEEIKTTTPPAPVSSEIETNKVSAETASLNSTTGTEENKGESPKENVSSKGNEDLSKSMETMVTLLTQLNNTLQGPLLVTSMSKKIE